MLASLLFYFAFCCVTFAKNSETSSEEATTFAELENWESLLRSQNVSDRSESLPYAIPNFYGTKKSDNPPPVCYGALGCFGLDSTWYDRSNRPLNVMPASPDRIRTRFTLYTRANPHQGYAILANTSESMLRAAFNPKLLTKFYIHGYGASGHEPHVKKIIANLLIHGDYNVLAVHWGDGTFPSYMQAVANIRVVGREIAHLINTFKGKFGVNPSNIHIIGHSLGAHAAGYAGEMIPNLGQITGLDPARPFFSGMPNSVRLDPTDANFVEAIHTDAGTLGIGIVEPIGHLDYYPNGGMQQPGCNPSSVNFNNLISSVMDSIGCNHQRAIHLYSDSFLSNSNGCETMAFECSDSKTFAKGECSTCGSFHSCPLFGPKSVEHKPHGRQNVKLYFHAGPKAPFCRFHVFITVDVGRISLTKSMPASIVSLLLVGEYETTEIVMIRPRVTNPLLSDKTLSLLYINETDIGKVLKVDVKWELTPGQGLPIGYPSNENFIINSVTIKVANSKRMRYPIKMCPANISSGRGKITLAGRTEFTAENCNI